MKKYWGSSQKSNRKNVVAPKTKKIHVHSKANVCKKYRIQSNGNWKQWQWKIYFGSCATDFKARLYNHRASFKNPEKKNTELAKHIWQLKNKKTTFNIKWEIIKKVPHLKPGERKCRLCLTEKYYIATNKSDKMLNTRSELTSRCRHMNKFYLVNLI